MKNNKIISVLLAILILLSAANLFVVVSNTIKIRQLEDTPPVVIEKNGDSSPVIQTIPFKDKNTTEKQEETTVEETEATKPTESEKTEENTTDKETTKAESSESSYCYVTSSGTKYHRNGCSYLKKSKTKMTVQEAKDCGYSPCSRCY